MSSIIVLRDIPKQTVQIDLWSYEIQGGFRGFQAIPPGVHYIKIQSGDIHSDFWVALPANEVVIKVFNYQQRQFVDDTPESAATYREMALGGAMGKTLIAYPAEEWSDWWSLTQHIAIAPQLPPLHHETVIQPPADLPPTELMDWLQHHHQSRFEQAFLGTHDGEPTTFLAEFQFAFVRCLLSEADQAAYDRWRHLLLAIYNAGERVIAQFPQLFCDIVDTLLAQFDYLPETLNTADSFVFTNLSQLIEDLIDTGLKSTSAKGQELADWFAERSPQ